AGVRVCRQPRLVGLDPVGVGLADTEVAADQQLRVTDREQRDRALLVGPGGQLVQRLRRARSGRVGGVGGGERRAAERRIDELVQQPVVAAVVLERGGGHGRLVGRGGLRGLAGGRVEQVARDRVVAL